ATGHEKSSKGKLSKRAWQEAGRCAPDWDRASLTRLLGDPARLALYGTGVGRTLTRFGRAYYKRFLCIRPQKAPCEVERWSSLVPETANAVEAARSESREES